MKTSKQTVGVLENLCVFSLFSTLNKVTNSWSHEKSYNKPLALVCYSVSKMYLVVSLRVFKTESHIWTMFSTISISDAEGYQQYLSHWYFSQICNSCIRNLLDTVGTASLFARTWLYAGIEGTYASLYDASVWSPELWSSVINTNEWLLICYIS